MPIFEFIVPLGPGKMGISHDVAKKVPKNEKVISTEKEEEGGVGQSSVPKVIIYGPLPTRYPVQK